MDLDTVEQIVTLLSNHAVSEIVVEQDGMRIAAKKPLMTVLPDFSPLAPDAQNMETMADEPAGAIPLEIVPEQPTPLLLTAGMVGLFRHSEPPLGYGAVVAPGQVVGSIEAMKVLNDVRADSAGQVVDIFVEEGAPVEYGQTLFRLMPD